MNSPTFDDPVIQQILQARARALAQVPEAEHVEQGEQFVVALLGQERYGVPLKFVQEIRHLQNVTRVPNIPTLWLGLVNLRGRLFPVLDLAQSLAVGSSGIAENGRLVLVTAAGLTVGLAVDQVLGVQRVPSSDIAPLFAANTALKRELISGITPDLLSLLDAETLLSDPKLIVEDMAF